ncbi:hypothetical protein [Methanopyrus sp.]
MRVKPDLRRETSNTIELRDPLEGLRPTRSLPDQNPRRFRTLATQYGVPIGWIIISDPQHAFTSRVVLS